MIETTNPTSPAHEASLVLTVKDSTGRMHELEIKQTGTNVPEIAMFGNNIMLQQQLQFFIDAMRRQGQVLF